MWKGPGPEDVVLWPEQISCQESVADSGAALCGSSVECRETRVTPEPLWVSYSAAAPGCALFPARTCQAQLAFGSTFSRFSSSQFTLCTDRTALSNNQHFKPNLWLRFLHLLVWVFLAHFERFWLLIF